jgi:hypothetical protein
MAPKYRPGHQRIRAAVLGMVQSLVEAGGSLLDHSIIVYGAGFSDGNRHRVVVAGLVWVVDSRN